MFTNFFISIFIETVKHLNISDNIVGHKSTKILAKFLSIPQCVLEVLILRNIQLGDEDCNDIVEVSHVLYKYTSSVCLHIINV